MGTGTFQVGYDASYADPRGRLFYGTINVMFHQARPASGQFEPPDAEPYVR
ncbi:MAG: hypothetical protein ACREMY_10475 [bacterium]